MANSNAQYAGRKLAIAAAVAALLGTDAYAAPAGSVDFSTGNVVATGADGRARPLAKGAELNSGDRVVTNDGRAQIRFADGAYVSLQPNTDFSIREYRYDGRTDGSERGVFGLLKGAMRTVTGAIGRVNRAAYEIQTPSATIGIRGTGGLVQVFDDGRTLLVGTSGVWTIAGLDKKNVIDLPAGQAAMTFPDPNKGPEKVSEGPVLPPAPLVPRGQHSPGEPEGPGAPTNNPIAGNIAESAIASVGPIPPGVIPPGIFSNTQELQALVTPPPLNPNPPLVSGSGFEVSHSYMNEITPSVFQVAAGAPFNVGQTAATFDPNGKMIGFVDGTQTKTLVGTHAEFGTDGGVVAWGRWIGQVDINGTPSVTYPPNQGLHYATGVPTPIAAITGSTGTVLFNFVGGTSPTDGTSVGSVDPSSKLSLLLGPSPKVGIDLKVNFPNGPFQVQTNGGVANPGASQIAVATGGPYSPFTGSLGSVSVPNTNVTGGICNSTGCAASIAGHFLGANATHAGLTYVVMPGFAPALTGAAAFKQ